MSDLIEVGDHVTIGSGKVHWVVDHLSYYGYAELTSGMTGKRWRAKIDELKIYRKGDAPAVRVATRG